MSFITDGTGTGTRARVNGQNQLQVTGNVRDELLQASIDGRAFNLNTETFTWTAASNDNAVLWLKNNGTSDLVLTNFFINQKNRAAGDSDEIRIYADPTAGTTNDIISTGTSTGLVNRRVGTPSNFSAEARTGGEGFKATFTEPPMIFVYSVGFSNIIVNYVVPQGRSIAVVCDRLGTTGDMYLGFNGYISVDV